MEQSQEKTIQDLKDQALDLRAILVHEWDVETHIELTARLFAIENQVEKEALHLRSLT